MVYVKEHPEEDINIQYGGKTLDCYKDDRSTLPYNYEDAGFIPVCRIHFDRSQVNGLWCAEAGTPDDFEGRETEFVKYVMEKELK